MLRPRGKNILAEPTEETNQIRGILLTADSAIKTSSATVVGTGEGVSDISPGDTIYFKPYSTSDFTINEKNYIIVHDDDVLGVE